jgi:hypothetical protein
MMNLRLIRRIFSEVSTIGELFIDDVHQCYTLEPAVKTDGSTPHAIPEGAYAVTIRESPRFGREMPHVENVPDFEGILIHWGNYPHDTEGCILVGENVDKNPDIIDTSKVAFAKLYPRLEGAESEGILIQIVSAEPATPVAIATVNNGTDPG